MFLTRGTFRRTSKINGLWGPKTAPDNSPDETQFVTILRLSGAGPTPHNPHPAISAEAPAVAMKFYRVSGPYQQHDPNFRRGAKWYQLSLWTRRWHVILSIYPRRHA